MARLSGITIPLQQISLDAVREKSVRHARISTLHILPVRRHLAASRAKALAMLVRDPREYGDRRRSREHIACRLGPRKLNGDPADLHHQQTDGRVPHWGREDQASLDPFRTGILASLGGPPPRVLDLLSGGGAIPLDTMCLGCETLASELNPVASFLLRSTLHTPHWVIRGTSPLSEFALIGEGEKFSSSCSRFRNSQSTTRRRWPRWRTFRTLWLENDPSTATKRR